MVWVGWGQYTEHRNQGKKKEKKKLYIESGPDTYFSNVVQNQGNMWILLVQVCPYAAQ